MVAQIQMVVRVGSSPYALILQCLFDKLLICTLWLSGQVASQTGCVDGKEETKILCGLGRARGWGL